MLQFNDRKLFIKLLNRTILPSSRNIVRIPDWEYHIRFDQRQGRKRPNQDALDRLKRLNNGMWIRAKPGRYHGHYKKDEYDQKLNDQWETCTKEQCAMLDAMMTPFWLRPKHYVNDPFEPYHTRYDIQSPRVNEKKRFVRERPKILLDDLTADRFFDRLPPHKTKSTLLIEQVRSDMPKLLKNASKKQLSLPISIVEQE